jgi:hypothetical protein
LQTKRLQPNSPDNSAGFMKTIVIPASQFHLGSPRTSQFFLVPMPPPDEAAFGFPQ